MKISFVNHSSFVIEARGVSIMTDPWIEGRVFNDGWDLLSQTKFTYDDFGNIDYIWFSHEHPDHFLPPNLKKIPPEHRARITVLFQRTEDKRVANFCRKLGFKGVVELVPDQRYSLAADFRVLCEPFTEGDSWISYETDEHTFLNTNDCGMRNRPEIERVRNKVGNVDVLLSQFSYAYWVGNPTQTHLRQAAADDKLEWTKFQCDIFEPRVFIPIASYIYFCHEENAFMNDAMNTAQKTYDFISSQTSAEPVVLYCGDEYVYPEPWDSGPAIASYAEDLRRVQDGEVPLVAGRGVELSELRSAAESFLEKLTKGHPLLSRTLRPARIHLTDRYETWTLSAKDGFERSTLKRDECDIALSSASLLFCLRWPYGADTLGINGRYTRPSLGDYRRFYNFFRIGQLESRGTDVNLGYLTGMVGRKVQAQLGLRRF